MKIIKILVVILFFSVSCQLENEIEIDNNKSILLDSHKTFAKILAQAMNDKIIKEFIKYEALKEIDNDYDVIYHYVKNKMLDNGLTFRENLAKYCENINILDEITESDKLLTILVPSLGENFSAKIWNTNVQTPNVAVVIPESDMVLAYSSNDSCFLSKKKQPEIAVVVIKSNERLFVRENMTRVDCKNILQSNDFVAFFLDEAFNNVKKENTKLQNTNDPNIDKTKIKHLLDKEQRITSSFLFNKESVRDYIYYGISPTLGIDEGTLNKEYHEYITAIEFNSYEIFSHVNDKSDPLGDWTDGNLEIMFDFIFIDKTGSVSNVSKMLSVKIDEVFKNNQALKYILPKPIEIFCWDMYTYGTTYKISVSEYDPGNVIEKTETISSTFSQNFELNSNIDLGIVKIGNKFGGTSTSSKQSVTKITTTNNSDPLGSVLVNFFDPLYTNNQIIKIGRAHV